MRSNAAGGGTRRADAAQRIEEALARPSHPFRVWHVREPDLLFGRGSHCPDPKTGIRIHGPCGNDDHPYPSIRVGIIGTGQTIDKALAWVDRCRQSVASLDPDVDPYLAVPFPGLSSSNGFDCRVEISKGHVRTLSPTDVALCANASNRDRSVEETARIVGAHLEALKDSESPPDVVLVALPDEVRTAAGGGRRPPRRSSPAASMNGAHGRRRQNPNQLTLTFFDTPPLVATAEPQSLSRTLHRAIKAEGMRQHLATQLVWSSTFDGGSGGQDDATRAWNFWTAIYYKALGAPWRVVGLPKNTCYVGISFYQPITEGGRLQTSMAQAFSDRGDGVVLRGASFEWNTKTQGPPRLPKVDARALLLGIVENYKKHHGQPPARVVIHKSSLFGEEERAGFADALAELGISYFDFVAVAYSSVRFFRIGKEPPIRGTVIELQRNKHLVYTRGYIPFLKLYPGMRIPTPLLVVHEGGSGAVRDIVEEMLALTRMNWNSADFATAEPITLKFSRQIGLILSELPKGIEVERHFKFYM
jgi:hypothetical protein